MRGYKNRTLYINKTDQCLLPIKPRYSPNIKSTLPILLLPIPNVILVL